MGLRESIRPPGSFRLVAVAWLGLPPSSSWGILWWGSGTLVTEYGLSFFTVIYDIVLPPRACVLNNIYHDVELFTLFFQSLGLQRYLPYYSIAS